MTCTASTALNQDGLLPSRRSFPYTGILAILRRRSSKISDTGAITSNLYLEFTCVPPRELVPVLWPRAFLEALFSKRGQKEMLGNKSESAETSTGFEQANADY